MSERPSGPPHGADLRAFRWPLRPLQRKLEHALEAARLVAAACRAREHRQQAVTDQWNAHHERQLRLAADCVRDDPRLAMPVLAYLSGVERRIVHEARTTQDLARQLAAARDECVRRDRELACVQALAERAQHAHAQEQLLRALREADAAWLARDQRRRTEARRVEAER